MYVINPSATGCYLPIILKLVLERKLRKESLYMASHVSHTVPSLKLLL